MVFLMLSLRLGTGWQGCTQELPCQCLDEEPCRPECCEEDTGIGHELRLVRQDVGSQNPGDRHSQVSKERLALSKDAVEKVNE